MKKIGVLNFTLSSIPIGAFILILFSYGWYRIFFELWEMYPNFVFNFRNIFRIVLIIFFGGYVVLKISLPSLQAILSKMVAVRVEKDGIYLFGRRYIDKNELSMKPVDNLFFQGVRFYEQGRYRGYVYSRMLTDENVHPPEELKDWIEREIARLSRPKIEL